MIKGCSQKQNPKKADMPMPRPCGHAPAVPRACGQAWAGRRQSERARRLGAEYLVAYDSKGTLGMNKGAGNISHLQFSLYL
jgi:hypothetical protein